MKQAEKLRKVKKIVFSMAIAVLLVATTGFSSMAAEADVLVDNLEEDEEVEVLYATLIEDFEPSSEISPYTMLADCIIYSSREKFQLH